MNTHDPSPSRVLTRRSARALDVAAAEGLGMPSLLLMENAGSALCQEILVRSRDPASQGGIVILCGPGNNGGDGCAAARRLLDGRRRVEVFALGEAPDPDSDSGRNRTILERAGFRLRACPRGTELARVLAEPLLVVDALFGTGLDRPLEGHAREVVETLNASGRRVVAADVPTGLDCDSGEVLGAAVRATSTVTFAAPKAGFFRSSGPAHVGRLVIGDLGLPPRFVDSFLEER